jgi:HTH-type transcriptional regulator/antitoxin HipB
MNAPIHAPRDVGLAIRGRRHELGWSQTELARNAGVSRLWISQCEQGKPTVELSLVLATLAALGLRLTVDRPAPTSPDDAAAPIDLDDLLGSLGEDRP